MAQTASAASKQTLRHPRYPAKLLLLLLGERDIAVVTGSRPQRIMGLLGLLVSPLNELTFAVLLGSPLELR